MIKKIIFFFLTLNFFLFAEEKKEDIDIKKLSEAIGHIIGKNLEDFGIELDLKKMIKGIKKGSLKKSSPMSEEDCLKALAILQEQANEKICKNNLEEAEKFLQNNSKDKNIKEIEKEKIQYQVLKKGKGEKVEPYNMPIVKINGKYLNGKTFTDTEEVLNLKETLPALQKAILGMQQKEKRTVFIHPSLSFGKTYPSLNSLVIYDIEVLQIDSKQPPLKEIANQNFFK